MRSFARSWRSRFRLCFGAAMFLLAPCGGAVTPPSRTLPRFPANAIWSQDVSAVTPDPTSDSMIGASVGWGTGGTKLSIDFSQHVVYSSWGSVTDTPIQQDPGGYQDGCDTGYTLPLPATGAVEATTSYTCDTGTNPDCRLLLVSGDNLYESFASNLVGGFLVSACVVRWRLNLSYPAEGRGDGCSSPSSAGLPIAPLLASPDDVYAAIQVGGDLGHALSFDLPNGSMRKNYYAHPASYGGAASSANAAAIPYGARLRLKSTFVISGYNAAAQVILRTLMKYGMFLSDAGNIPLEFDDGLFDTHHWIDADINLGSTSLWGVALTDFDVMPIGTPVAYSLGEACTLNHFGDDV